MRRLPALAVTAAGVALALSGCVVLPPPIPDEVVEVALDGASVDLSLPPTAEVGGPSSQPGSCATSSVHVGLGDSWRAGLELMTTTATTSCPDEEPLNGRYPTWGPSDALPADATPVDVAGASDAHRFAFSYTECTNSCTTMTREVLVAVVDADLAVVIVGRDVDSATFDAWAASVRLG